MTPPVATSIFVTGIVGLFVLGRERRVVARRDSACGRAPRRATTCDFRGLWATWIPTVWLLIAGSRHVSAWLAVGGEGGSASTLSTQQYLDGSPLDASVYALLIAAALAVLMGRRKAVVSILENNWPIVFFVIYCALSITWSDFPGVALKRWIKSLGDYAMILVLLTERNRGAAIRTTLARVSFVLLPLSILFIKYYPDLGRAHAGQWEVGATMVGVTDDKNMLGLTSLIFGFTAFNQVLEIQNRPRNDRLRILIVNGAVVAMALHILLLSRSMTSLSCFVLAGGVVVAHRFFRAARNHIVLHSLVATVVACPLLVLFWGVGDRALQQMGRNPTLTGRTAIWEILWTVPVNPVIGTGFESFWLGPRLNYLWSFHILYGITEAHNGYFDIYLNLGLMGDLFLGVLLWTGYWKVMRVLDVDPPAGRLRLGYCIIAVIYNFTEAGFRSGDLIWFTFILAIAVQQRVVSRAVPSKWVPKPRKIIDIPTMTGKIADGHAFY